MPDRPVMRFLHVEMEFDREPDDPGAVRDAVELALRRQVANAGLTSDDDRATCVAWTVSELMDPEA